MGPAMNEPGRAMPPDATRALRGTRHIFLAVGGVTVGYVRVDVWADLVCPWCYLGKRRFEQALTAFAHRDEVEVVFHSFQLDASLPKGEKVSQLDLLISKYGIPPTQVESMQAELERTAAAEGLEYHLRGGMTGNTFDAHRLVHLAQASGHGDAVVERFYRAHFTEQRSLFDHDSLVDLAAEAGLDPVEARRVLKDDDYAEAVADDEREARELGATGVPFFVIDERYGVSGAQSAELFGEVLARAWSDA